MLICVDGTWGIGIETPVDVGFGTKFRAANYAVAMMSSFVGMIYYRSHLQNRRYYQGPDAFGCGPNFVSPAYLVQQIMEFWRQGDHQVIMAGYSRGAAMVIAAAAGLNGLMPGIADGALDVKIEAMFLFDAVAKSPNPDVYFGTDWIPSNVTHCYHAIRDDRAQSRSSFGHCGGIANVGTSLRGITYFVPRKFYTTHGGMGGVLWGEKGIPELSKDIEQQVFNQRTREAYAGGPSGTLQRFNHPFVPDLQAARAAVLSRGYIHENFPDGETKVTVEQEKRGSQEVHDWMWPFLTKHHVL
jgi:hypothetical protein